MSFSAVTKYAHAAKTWHISLEVQTFWVSSYFIYKATLSWIT